MTTFTTSPGAAIGSDSDTLPMIDDFIAFLDALNPERQQIDIQGVSFDHRKMIARITNLVIDVSLNGRYHAHASFTSTCWDFCVYVCRHGESATDAIYRRHAYLRWHNDSPHAPANALPDMIDRLEALMAEGQPS